MWEDTWGTALGLQYFCGQMCSLRGQIEVVICCLPSSQKKIMLFGTGDALKPLSPCTMLGSWKNKPDFFKAPMPISTEVMPN